MSDYRKLTQAELVAEAKERFGDNPTQWKFVCPVCGDVACAQDFFDIAADPNRVGQECIGRSMGSRGCDWAAYGLIRGPWEIVMPAEGDKPERSAWGFALAEVSP